MADFGINQALVDDYLRQLRLLNVEQWRRAKKAALLIPTTRHRGWYGCRDLAVRDKRLAQWEAARDAAFEEFEKAFPPGGTLSQSFQNSRLDQARAAAEEAAQAIVVADLIADSEFELFTGPMRMAGVRFTSPHAPQQIGY